MIAPFHDISSETLATADLVLAIDPNEAVEKELYCDPSLEGGKSILRAVRVVVALLDKEHALSQIESLRLAIRKAKAKPDVS